VPLLEIGLSHRFSLYIKKLIILSNYHALLQDFANSETLLSASMRIFDMHVENISCLINITSVFTVSFYCFTVNLNFVVTSRRADIFYTRKQSVSLFAFVI